MRVRLAIWLARLSYWAQLLKLWQQTSGKHIFEATRENWSNEPVLGSTKKSSTLPRVVWDEESKNGLRFEIGPSYYVVPTMSQCPSDGQFSCSWSDYITIYSVYVEKNWNTSFPVPLNKQPLIFWA